MISDFERVYVACDVSNLWYSAKDQFGHNARVNYGTLKDLLRSKQLGNLPRYLQMVAYTVTLATKKEADGTVKFVGPRNAKFLETLKKAGYEIKNRNMHYEKGINSPFSTDWDVGISIDALNNIDNFDTFALVSGDGDYSMLLNTLNEKSKYTEVYTFESTASKFLHSSAQRVLHLSEKEVFFQLSLPR